jgi:sec-independent protein translocase protein TatB
MLMKNARKLAGEFQSGVNEIIREADLDEARKKLSEVQSLNKTQIQNAIEKAVDPTGEVKSALKIEDDPTGPARMQTTTAESKPALESPSQSGEDDAVEIAAAAPLPKASDTAAPTPEPAAAEKT